MDKKTILKIYNEIRSLLKGRILDIGCGKNEFVRFLRKMGYTAYGIDINYLKKRHFILMDCERMGFKVKFDVITSFDAFEHMSKEKRGKCLDMIVNLLKSGGYFVFTSPNDYSLWPRDCHSKLPFGLHIPCLPFFGTGMGWIWVRRNLIIRGLRIKKVIGPRNVKVPNIFKPHLFIISQKVIY